MYIYFFLVIAKTEELSKDMEFIGQMANVSFITTLGEMRFYNYWSLEIILNLDFSKEPSARREVYPGLPVTTR